MSEKKLWVNRTQFGNFDCIHAYEKKISDDHDPWVPEALLLEEKWYSERLAQALAGLLEGDLNCECGYYDEVDQAGNAVMSMCWKCIAQNRLGDFRFYEKQRASNG